MSLPAVLVVLRLQVLGVGEGGGRSLWTQFPS